MKYLPVKKEKNVPSFRLFVFSRKKKTARIEGTIFRRFNQFNESLRKSKLIFANSTPDGVENTYVSMSISTPKGNRRNYDSYGLERANFLPSFNQTPNTHPQV